MNPETDALPFVRARFARYGIDVINKGRSLSTFKFLIIGRPGQGRQIGIYERRDTVVRLERYDQAIPGVQVLPRCAKSSAAEAQWSNFRGGRGICVMVESTQALEALLDWYFLGTASTRQAASVAAPAPVMEDRGLPRFDDVAPPPAAPRSAPAGELSGLIIRRDPLRSILRGEKTWEMRSKMVHKRGRIALIEKGSGLVMGVARLIDCQGPFTDEQMLAHQEKHRIEPERLRQGEVTGWRIAWVLQDVRPLPQPVPYSHPSGAVTWVTLEADVVGRVIAQVGE